FLLAGVVGLRFAGGERDGCNGGGGCAAECAEEAAPAKALRSLVLHLASSLYAGRSPKPGPTCTRRFAGSPWRRPRFPRPRKAFRPRRASGRMLRFLRFPDRRRNARPRARRAVRRNPARRRPKR